MSLNLKNMSTETRNQNTMDLDMMSPLEIVTLMNQEDAKVPEAIKPALPNIAQCVSWAIESIEAGGRIVYMGAGTSGRLGVLDAVECPPTFGVAPEVVVGLIAGGEKAFVKAVEGAEDSRQLGHDDLVDIGLQKRDIVIGIAASGRTPYVLGGLGLLFYIYAIVLSVMTLRTEKKAQERAYSVLQRSHLANEEELADLKKLFHLYNVQYINDIILASLELIYTLLKIDEIIKCIWCYFRLRSGKWLKKIQGVGAKG